MKGQKSVILVAVLICLVLTVAVSIAYIILWPKKPLIVEEFTDRPKHEPSYEVGEEVNGGIVKDFDSYNNPYIKYPVEVKPEEQKKSIEDFIAMYNIVYNFTNYEVIATEETPTGFFYTLKLPGFTALLRCENMYGEWSYEFTTDSNDLGYYYGDLDIDPSTLPPVEHKGILIIDSIEDGHLVTHASYDVTEVINIPLEED